MPLQIRRGTDAERQAMTVPLASGEPLWTTDDQRLYIGNGTTLPGSLTSVTGYTDEDTQEAVAELLLGASPITAADNSRHTGIVFVYDDDADRIDATVDFSNIDSLVVDSIQGSLFSDNSTLLVDATTGVFTGDFVGNLTGNVTGNLVGDIKGSVFGDDSSIIVDSNNNLINTPIILSNTGQLKIGDEGEPLEAQFFTANASNAVTFNAINSGVPPSINLNVSGGNYTVPTELDTPLTVQSGINFNSFVGGSFVPQVSLFARNSIDSDFLSIAPGGELLIQVANNDEFHYYTFGHQGIFQPTGGLQFPTFVNGLSYFGSSALAVELNDRPEPVPDALNSLVGTIIFDSDLGAFKGWTNDSDGTGTPGFEPLQMRNPIAATYTTATLPDQAAFTGSISGTTLTVTAGPTTGYIKLGMKVEGASVAANTYILEDLGGGTYLVNNSQTVTPAEAMTGPTVTAGTIIFVSDATSGNKFKGWDGSNWVPLG
jgi:hypothetical protein